MIFTAGDVKSFFFDPLRNNNKKYSWSVYHDENIMMDPTVKMLDLASILTTVMYGVSTEAGDRYN